MSKGSPPSRSAFSNLLRQTWALVLVAVGASAFAVLFRAAINGVFHHVYGAKDVLAAFAALSWPLRVAIPSVGGALAGFLGLAASKIRGGQGVGDVMEAVALGKHRVSFRVAALKAAGSFLAIVSGGSIGREGPIIQIGGSLGGGVARAFGLTERQTRALIAAGTASGFAAAYNTPLAAVLFVVEIVTGVIALEVVLPAIVATAIATSLTRFAVGGGPIYGQRTFAAGAGTDLLVDVLLGLVAGLAGPAFMEMLSRGENLFARLRLPRPLAGALGGLAVGGLAVLLPEVTGNGYEAINLILGGGVTAGLMLVLLLAKSVATTASVSSGSPGGVFTPVLFLGAALGGAIGHFTSLVVGSGSMSAVGGYALVGMAAMTASTTHAPVLAAVMVFELSGDYAIVLPLLIATATATALSRRIRPTSIYMEELRRKGKGWEMTLGGRRMQATGELEPRLGGEPDPD